MKNQTFGIEIEMNGILRIKAAAVIAAHFGTTESRPDGTCYHTQTIRMPDGRVWKVMRDSSMGIYDFTIPNRTLSEVDYHCNILYEHGFISDYKCEWGDNQILIDIPINT